MPHPVPGFSKPPVYPPLTATAAFDVVVIAASAGGLPALAELISLLPRDFPAAIVVVQHRGPTSELAYLLNRCDKLPVHDAVDGDLLQPGKVYLAPPVHHTWINPDRTLRVASALQIRAMRPNADLLFNSAAATYGARAIGVILSGMLDDGAAGAYTIKRLGGRVIAQDEQSAQAFDMPSAAIATGCVDFILPPAKIAAALAALTMAPGAAAFLYVPLQLTPGSARANICP